MAVTADIGTYRIEQVDVPRLGDADLESLARFWQVFERERMPEDPPIPIELNVRRARNRPGPAVLEQTDWIVRAGGEVIAAADLQRWKTVENPHWRDAWIGVRPEHRRRGLGTRLLAEVARAAERIDPEIVLGSWQSDRVPAGSAFAQAIGAKVGLAMRTSQLVLKDVDRELVAKWAAIRTPGYRLAWVDGDMPEELVANAIVAFDTMNTAPLGDLQFGAWKTTAEEIRTWDETRRKSGGQHRLVIAIDEATGATVGFTEVGRHPLIGWLIRQQGTAVVPEHRGRGIGKWMKAVMLDRIFREWPDALFVRTGNAYVNAPMLSINDRLGFKPAFTTNIYQVPLADVKRYLEGRSA